MPAVDDAPGCPFSRKKNLPKDAICPVSGKPAIQDKPVEEFEDTMTHQQTGCPISHISSTEDRPVSSVTPGCPVERTEIPFGSLPPAGCPASRMKKNSERLVCPVTGAVAGDTQPTMDHPEIESITFPFLVSHASVEEYTKACTGGEILTPLHTYGMLMAMQKRSLLFDLLSRLQNMQGEILSWEHYLRVAKPLVVAETTSLELQTTQFPVAIENLENNDSVQLTDGFEGRDEEGTCYYYNEVTTVIRGAVTKTPAKFRPRASFTTNKFLVPVSEPLFKELFAVTGDLTGNVAYRLVTKFGDFEEIKFGYGPEVTRLGTEVLSLSAWEEDHLRYGRVVVFRVAEGDVLLIDGCMKCAD
ncbi:hypothetical protein BABINDRAFT_159625 [Babjeviella inositovora NRRL Y-12698]|uniref:Uncharacterized protein n=1 Tax=Babjeviella inositovora NRRL Y-12698 TaxID=984486 RepID=A0A1E3QZS9_9ASCO|nr:uncharacterized protein BABINDRAFT_159625 [Babjeviella inositovora NRRL Y-12698]ODQ83183.1 hypothetical protein BABINDRAFT_159625 [Babjeviella inositovora NRRL Y-12698]